MKENNSFTIKCNNCGKEIELKDCFKEQEYEGIDIFDLMMGGVLILKVKDWIKIIKK